jgi:hypothetical protein
MLDRSGRPAQDDRVTRPIPAFGRLYPDIVRAGSFGALVDQMFWTLGSELRSEPDASWHRVDVVADARVGSLETGTDSRSFHVRIRQHDAKRVLLAGGRTDRLWQAVSAIRSILEQQDRAVWSSPVPTASWTSSGRRSPSERVPPRVADRPDPPRPRAADGRHRHAWTWCESLLRSRRATQS